MSQPMVSDRLETRRAGRNHLVAGLPWLLAAGWAAQAALRLWLSWGQAAPSFLPDESGYLIGARWLAGGPGTDLSGYTLYPGGYSLLVAPAFLVSHDPGVVYRLVLGINALVGAAVFPLGYLLLRRLRLAPMPALPLAWAVALLPACTLYGVTAQSDAVLPAVVLGWLLALDRFVGHAGPKAGVLASLLACFAYAAHSRGAVILLVHGLVVCAYLIRGAARGTAAVALGVTAAGGAGAVLLNARLAAALYPHGALDLGDLLWDRLTTVHGQAWSLSGGAGQIWAMVAATWGLGAPGLVAVGLTVFRRRTRQADRVMAGALLVVTLGIAYAASAALPDEHRVGNFAYSRYLSCVALVYALIGLVVVIRSRAAARLVAAGALLMAGTGLWVAVHGGSRLRTYTFVAWDFPEVGLLGGSWNQLHVVTTSLTTCALLAGLAVLARWKGPLLFGAILIVNLSALTLIVLGLARPGAEPVARPASPRGGVAVAQTVPGAAYTPPAARGYPAIDRIYARLAFHVWWTRIGRFDPRRGLPGPGVCAAIVSWPAGTSAEDTWPGHPADWRFAPGGPADAAQPRWVTWYAPGC
ncbi:hypothetical protein ACRYCC_12125 [Actinomadura scrupuli]|uniref:hypothetical protein n=1 Tax=Actinomadura scrupuli TaxID=559629 RepID=UPI003D951283